MKAELKNISTWVEKGKHALECGQTIRIYCGSFFCGKAFATKGADTFTFSSRVAESIKDINRQVTLEEVKEHVELSLKEFLSKIAK